jgi:site-specific DNA recombinase
MSPSLPKSRKKNHPTNTLVAPPQYALYMRVSTEDQADRGTIEAQREFLQHYVQLYQLPVFREYADDGVTGTLPLGERPEGRRLLEDAQAGHVQTVLVYRVTRLGRSLRVLIDAHEQLSLLNVTFRSAMEPFDTGNAVGRFFFQLLGSMAELDRSLTLEQLTRGRDRWVRDGRWTDGCAPYGFMLDAAKRLTPSDRLVGVVDMTEADVVRDLYTHIAAGSSAKAEAVRLTALGVPTTRYFATGRTQAGGRKWHTSALLRIMQSTTYKGEHRFASQYGAIARAVPALVDPQLWEQANAQLQKNRRLPKGNATRTYLLRGLVTCGQCDAHYVGQRVGARHGGNRIYYRCGGHSAAGDAASERCTSPSVQAAWLEQEIWRDCAEYVRNPDQALAEAQRQLQERTQHASGSAETRAQLTKGLVEKAREREDVVRLYRRKSLDLVQLHERY